MTKIEKLNLKERIEDQCGVICNVIEDNDTDFSLVIAVEEHIFLVKYEEKPYHCICMRQILDEIGVRMVFIDYPPVEKIIFEIMRVQATINKDSYCYTEEFYKNEGLI